MTVEHPQKIVPTNYFTNILINNYVIQSLSQGTFPIPLDPVLRYYGAGLIHQISDLGLDVESINLPATNPKILSVLFLSVFL